MSNELNAALMTPDSISDLAKEFPRGSFAHTNANIIRQVVQSQKESLSRRNIGLRLRVEPPHDAMDSKGRPLPPTRLIVRDGDIHFRIPIEVYENHVVIGQTGIMTGRSENPVADVAAAIAKEVAKRLGLSREAAIDAQRTAMLGGE